jgi:hypothetical protein
MPQSFRHSAGFGKRIEYWVAGLMLKEGIDVYMPLVDDNGIDAVVRREDGSFIEVQIKARSGNVTKGTAAYFGPYEHELRPNYYFVFYSEILQTFWIMSSEEFLNEAYMYSGGKSQGTRRIKFDGRRKNKSTGEHEAYCLERFQKYIATDFSRLNSSD